MNTAALKDILFERFETSRQAFIEKRNKFQRELDQDVNQLRQAYGDEAVNGLGTIELSVGQSSPPSRSPTVVTTASRPRSQPKRKRSRKSSATRTMLEQHVPKAAEAVGGTMKEFLARDVYEHLTKVLKLDVAYARVSGFLGENAKKLGLAMEKRLLGEKPARMTNIFQVSQKLSATKKAKGSSKKGQRVDWASSISAAIQGLRKGATKTQLQDQLVRDGVPADKFRGPGFRQALDRLVNEKKVVKKNDIFSPKE